MPPAYTNLLAAALHPLTTWVLMNKVGMGFQGAAAAYSVANVLQVALLLGVIISWKVRPCLLLLSMGGRAACVC